MSPSFARFNATNGVLKNAIFSGNNPLKSRVCKDGADLRLGQFGRSASFASVRRSMFGAIQLVIARCIPAQIAQMVVPRVSIIVAPFHSLWPQSNKSLKNRFVRVNSANLVIFPKPHKWAAFLFVMRKFFQFACLCGAYLPMIRNLVKAFITNDTFPNFHINPRALDIGMIA